ncbi:RP-S18e [Mytilus edulis]|uniref:RP-S18e n=1 Tax=Mytilus edulis TaxID=6550 RepID=A0A8S3RU64_MYTED|nr:RP-S18e [Mytilus edulis]
MKDVFESLIGTYLLKIGEQYKVQHDKMFDFMCCYFGNKKEMVRCILHYADIRVINERTELQSITWINEEHDRLTVLITEDTEKEYFKRIRKDLKDGKMSQCFHNSLMKYDAYRYKLLRLLEELNVDFLTTSTHTKNSSKHEDNGDQSVGTNQFDNAIATFLCDENKHVQDHL